MSIDWRVVKAMEHINKRPKSTRFWTPKPLPTIVLNALHKMLDPGSPANPFTDSATRWQVYISFTILLELGLRLDELMSLPADALEGSQAAPDGQLCYVMNVWPTSKIGYRPRARRLRVSQHTAQLIHEYLKNHRGRPNHLFLLNSPQNLQLTAERLRAQFKVISKHLPEMASKSLEDCTGSSQIYGNDLRRTCAALCLEKMLGRNALGQPQIFDVLRVLCSFFGWSSSYAFAFVARSALWEQNADEALKFTKSSAFVRHPNKKE